MRSLVFVVKDGLLTSMMQQFDVFERFKFIGLLVKEDQEDTHKHLSAREVLDRCLGVKDQRFSVVGVIIPGVDAAFVPNHIVLSTGDKWVTIADICVAYNVKQGE